MEKTGKSKGHKIYVTVDMEGASGVYKFTQTRDRIPEQYREAMEYLMGDIAALVNGLRDAGASEILVADCHSIGNNFIPHLMAPGAKYLTGTPRPTVFPGLDKTFDGFILLAHHAMKGTKDGVLNHTQSSKLEKRYWYNGRESGELAQAAATAGHFGVPVIMATGDEATCREARAFFGPKIVTVATKKGLDRECAILFPLEETQKAIYNGAKHALAAIPQCRPYLLKVPIKAKMEYIEVKDRPSETRLVKREAVLRDIKNIINF